MRKRRVIKTVGCLLCGKSPKIDIKKREFFKDRPIKIVSILAVVIRGSLAKGARQKNCRKKTREFGNAKCAAFQSTKKDKQKMNVKAAKISVVFLVEM